MTHVEPIFRSVIYEANLRQQACFGGFPKHADIVVSFEDGLKASREINMLHIVSRRSLKPSLKRNNCRSQTTGRLREAGCSPLAYSITSPGHAVPTRFLPACCRITLGCAVAVCPHTLKCPVNIYGPLFSFRASLTYLYVVD